MCLRGKSVVAIGGQGMDTMIDKCRHIIEMANAALMHSKLLNDMLVMHIRPGDYLFTHQCAEK